MHSPAVDGHGLMLELVNKDLTPDCRPPRNKSLSVLALSGARSSRAPSATSDGTRSSIARATSYQLPGCYQLQLPATSRRGRSFYFIDTQYTGHRRAAVILGPTQSRRKTPVHGAAWRMGPHAPWPMGPHLWGRMEQEQGGLPPKYQIGVYAVTQGAPATRS
jgi:hypothetical protein